MNKEYQWFAKHSLEISRKFRGENIAIVGSKIVAHGKDFKKVARKAQKVSPNPLFAKIPKEDIVVYYDRV